MDSLKFKYFLLVVVCVLLTLFGCKKTGDFIITGIWEVKHTRLNSSPPDTEIIRYKFSGNKKEGSVSTVPPSAGFTGGSYQVEGNHIDFIYHYGRGVLFFRFEYTGEIYPELAKIAGNVEFIRSDAGEETQLWSGTFVAIKYRDD